ncbi:MAG TPA: methionine biosynthesis protein MetW [Azoarcus sp.]|nr:methionine biosynthesis protein MetW [Azoarcus sp.]
MSPTYRYDYDVITNWITPGESVLDLGCGDGSLLAHLTRARQIRGWGVENDPDNIAACIANGVNVIQVDLEKGLAGFEDGFFNHVIMSLSLQTIHNTLGILNEMLRVGRDAVVSFPNFGYWRHRDSLLQGRMPVSDILPHQWFNTPNVRFFTVADFDALCAEQGIVIHERLGFDKGRVVHDDLGSKASVAVYRLGRNTDSPSRLTTQAPLSDNG